MCLATKEEAQLDWEEWEEKILFFACFTAERKISSVHWSTSTCSSAHVPWQQKSRESERKASHNRVVILACWCSHLRLDKAVASKQQWHKQPWSNSGLLSSWLFCCISGKIQLTLAPSFVRPVLETRFLMHFSFSL